MPKVTFNNIHEFAGQHADRKSRRHTDESNLYPSFGGEFATHETVNHGEGVCSRQHDNQLG